MSLPATVPVLTAESMVKTCSKCGEVKGLRDFSRDASKRDGRSGRCKGCQKAVSAAWYRTNLDRSRERNSAWRAANPERKRETSAAWYQANAQEERSRVAAWQGENPEAVAAERARRSEREAAAMCPCMEGWGRKRLRGAMKLAEPSCYLCGEPSVGTDHVVPLVEGGRHCWGNLRGCCFRCNSRKGRRSAADYVARMEAEGTPVAAGWDSPGPLHCTV